MEQLDVHKPHFPPTIYVFYLSDVTKVMALYKITLTCDLNKFPAWFSTTWSSCHRFYCRANTNFTQLSDNIIFNMYWCHGISTYFMSMSRVLDLGTDSDSRHWYRYGCIPNKNTDTVAINQYYIHRAESTKFAKIQIKTIYWMCWRACCCWFMFRLCVIGNRFTPALAFCQDRIWDSSKQSTIATTRLLPRFNCPHH